MIKMRKFKEHDYDLYAGVSTGKYLVDAFICEDISLLKDGTKNYADVLIDDAGIGVNYYEDEDGIVCGSYCLDCDLQTAFAIAQDLTTEMKDSYLIAKGFKQYS